jgi:hypothetical protein
MSDDLLVKVIQIKEVGVEDKRLKVVDMEGKVYSIWRTKKDGTETQAYTAFKDVALSAQGKSYEVAYDEKPNPQGPGTFFRAIKMVKLASQATPAEQVRPIQTVNPVQNNFEQRIKALEDKVFGVDVNSIPF